MFDPTREVSGKIDIRIRSTQSQHNRKFVSPERYLESFDLHPKGHTLASVHRGGLFSMGLWTGAPLRLGTVAGVRYRLGSWLPDGEHIVAVTDEGGKEALIVFRADGGESPNSSSSSREIWDGPSIFMSRPEMPSRNQIANHQKKNPRSRRNSSNPNPISRNWS